MKIFYILAALSLSLYIWLFSLSDNDSDKYFKKLTSNRVVLSNGFHIKEVALFDANTLYLETPGQYYEIKYKEKQSDSLYIFQYYNRYSFESPLKYLIEDKKLSIQLDPKLKAMTQRERQQLAWKINGQDKEGIIQMLASTRISPKAIELSPFTTVEFNWDFEQKVNKLDIKLDEGAVAYLNNVDIDTLYLSSDCNSVVNLVGSSVNYLKHKLEGGKIESKNTTVFHYDVKRSTSPWCTAAIDLDVTDEISGTIESNTVTRIRYPNDPKINLIKQSNTKIRKGAKQDYAEIYKEMMKKYTEKKLKKDGSK
jgi:hypothetical protein